LFEKDLKIFSSRKERPQDYRLLAKGSCFFEVGRFLKRLLWKSCVLVSDVGAMRSRKRKCRHCKIWYVPNRRLKDRQVTCGKKECVAKQSAQEEENKTHRQAGAPC